MNILGIETSCDETAAAVVQNGRRILSNTVVSSLKEHSRFGGIIPEIASRRQLECINPVVEQAFAQAHVKLSDIDAIAVTASPGLIGSLLVGVSFAQALSFALNKPLFTVDHIKAHLYANFLTFEDNGINSLPRLPAIGLVVSGGHTSLFHVKDFHRFELVGQTRDDAAGEAFDKVARMLQLGYPGGPAIEKKAQQGKKSQIQFTAAALPDTLDFSYSGLKTAVLYHARDHEKQPGFSVADVAYAFQESIVNNLVSKCVSACKKFNTKTLLVGGGVAANQSLRTALANTGQREEIDVFTPPMSLCLDNAAMIAGLAYHLQPEKLRKLRKGVVVGKNSRDHI